MPPRFLFSATMRLAMSPCVDGVGAARLDEPERVREVLVDDRVADLGREPVPGVDGEAVLEPGELAEVVLDDLREVHRHGHPAFGPVDGGLNHLGAAQLLRPVMVQRVEQALHLAGHRRGQAAFDRGIADGAAPLIELVHVRRGGSRGSRAEVDDHRFLHAGQLDDHEAAAADARGVRLEDAQRETRGDGGVDGVAAHLQDLDAGLRRLGLWPRRRRRWRRLHRAHRGSGASGRGCAPGARPAARRRPPDMVLVRGRRVPGRRMSGSPGIRGR